MPEREEFDTGSVRDRRDGKGRYDLIPPGPLHRLALRYEHGVSLYGAHNWEKGQPCSRFFDSAMRHLMQYRAGQDDEDHLAAVIFNVMGIMEMQAKHPEMEDINEIPCD